MPLATPPPGLRVSAPSGPPEIAAATVACACWRRGERTPRCAWSRLLHSPAAEVISHPRVALSTARWRWPASSSALRAFPPARDVFLRGRILPPAWTAPCLRAYLFARASGWLAQALVMLQKCKLMQQDRQTEQLRRPDAFR